MNPEAKPTVQGNTLYAGDIIRPGSSTIPGLTPSQFFYFYVGPSQTNTAAAELFDPSAYQLVEVASDVLDSSFERLGRFNTLKGSLAFHNFICDFRRSQAPRR
jgi:hypothetical protein